MNCKKCKALLPQGAVYCAFCGRKQIAAPTGRTRPNGTGTAYKRGKTWTVEVVVGQGQAGRPIRRTKGGFRTKTAALAYAPELKGLARPAEKTLQHYWDTFLNGKYQSLSRSKQIAYNIAWARLDSLQYSLLSALDLRTLQTALTEQTPTHYPARDLRTVLSHLYELAIIEGAAATNLARHLSIPALVEAEQTAFDDEELAQLWSAYELEDPFVGFVLLMIYTGMMPGELLILKKEMINWSSQTITGCGLKTDVRKAAAIAMPAFILPVLRTLCNAAPHDKVLPMAENKFRKEFADCLQRHDCRPLTPYACRHTTATALALGNQVAPSVIQKVMRHARFATTTRYIHADSSDAVAALNTLRVAPG